jgi:hypothetical protein
VVFVAKNVFVFFVAKSAVASGERGPAFDVHDHVRRLEAIDERAEGCLVCRAEF